MYWRVGTLCCLMPDFEVDGLLAGEVEPCGIERCGEKDPTCKSQFQETKLRVAGRNLG